MPAQYLLHYCYVVCIFFIDILMNISFFYFNSLLLYFLLSCNFVFFVSTSEHYLFSSQHYIIITLPKHTERSYILNKIPFNSFVNTNT